MADEGLITYKMMTLLSPPKGVYKDDKPLTDEQRKRFMAFNNLDDAHAYYSYWSKQNYTDEIRSVLEALGA